MKLIVYGLILLSQQLLYNAKTGGETKAIQDSIAHIPIGALTEELATDLEKKTFWLNIYNANIQLQLKGNEGKYTNRHRFFTTKNIIVTGKKLSFDDIEHGILRRSKNKLSLGYFNKWFVGAFERKNRVTNVDYRIHFALNCGAKSCPPIAFYDPEKIDVQLDLATKTYLTSEVVFDSIKSVAKVPILMLWFKGDFNRKNGIYALLSKLELIPLGIKPTLEYKKYNWDLMLNNYNE